MALLLCGLAGGCGTELVVGRTARDGQDTPAALPDLDAPVSCGSDSPDAAAACVERERLQRDVATIALPRPSGSRHHRAVQQLCAQTLEALGYEVALQPYGSGTNVVGRKLGLAKPDEVVVVGGHYDQLPDCAGADDNASGVAATLETARVLASGSFERTLEVACWDEGERGWHGSAAHAAQLRQARRPRLAVVYESVAFRSEQVDSQHIPEGFERLWPDQALALLDDDNRARFLTVVTDSGAEGWAKQLAAQARSKELTAHVLLVTEAVKKRQKRMYRTDHSSFWEAKVPALLVTDTGRFRNPLIACSGGQDAPQTLDYGFLTVATRAAVAAIVSALTPQ